MLEVASVTIDIDEYGGGSLKGSTSRYKPRELKGLTHCFDNHTTGGAETVAAFAIRIVDFFDSASQPLAHELPHTIMEIIAAEPSSSVAVKYRGYVKAVLMPICRRVSGILHEHSAAIEWPTVAWMKDKVRHPTLDYRSTVETPHHMYSFVALLTNPAIMLVRSLLAYRGLSQVILCLATSGLYTRCRSRGCSLSGRQATSNRPDRLSPSPWAG